ncbi:hypothetical protein [Halocalculus aciditolerans]|uniref:Uncharacterized protein n=1 Tax=Halocalculus aciditolerans TaxID=1383812 RepID=A0A830FBZ0_9EURY|nr:hypothetical protein [Halocalculus aciditolerans]GGL59722.1 hypothetical protein GCM10009039_17440 [Halocalculus aciditolerans]
MSEKPETPLGDLRDQLDDARADDADAAVTEESADGPAFEFTNDLQRSIYPRPESWEALQDAIDFEVKRRLAERDIRDFTGREAHDAMVTLAAENPERLAELVLDARGYDTA